MGGDRVRDEAERLVAAAIAAVSTSMRAGRQGFATGSAECCVCPVCRAIAALRDPAPEFAERIATGVGDLAAGVASMLRMLQRPAAETPTQRTPEEGDEFWEVLRRRAADAAKAAARSSSTMDASTVDDDVWSAATAEAPAPAPRAAEPPPPVKKVAKKAVAKKAAPPPPRADVPPPPAPPVKVAKKAVAKKAVAKKAVKTAVPPVGF
jgi:hypothetical protein